MGQILAQKSKCSKSLQNEQERRPHHKKSNALQTGSNVHRMSEISRSVQFAKHGKKLLTVQSIQSLHVDVAGSYSPTWHDDDMEGVDWTTEWEMWVNHVSTRGILLANSVVPHGPGMGCHVAPYFGMLKFMWSPRGSNPGPPTICKVLAKVGLPTRHALVLILYTF
jgi:hypothetical protein